jgi:hypothetical protein
VPGVKNNLELRVRLPSDIPRARGQRIDIPVIPPDKYDCTDF